MFPGHCKNVSVKRVSFPLTEDDIQNNLLNKPAYTRTEFLVLNNGDEWAVVRVEKGAVKNLFSRIEKMEVISLPGSTAYLEDSSIDVLSPTMMAEKAEELGSETLIIKGKFEHVSFIHKETYVPLVIYEVVPPEPPKLVELVRKVLYSGSINRYVKVSPEILDLREIACDSKNQNIVFPCHSSGLVSEGESFYLDQRPRFSEEEAKNVYLIGCDLSLRIFKTLYGVEPSFFNFCPKKRAIDTRSERYAMTKCCKVKKGHERIGNVTIVPWGATLREVEDALNDLLKDANIHNMR